MLTISKIQSPGQASSYFEKDDYYTRDNLAPSEWYGAGAARLDLSGTVDRGQFQAILAGELPDGQVMRGPNRTDENGKPVERMPGVDLTFSAPKSVSVLAEVYGDTRLLEAHREAVKATVDHIQESIRSRIAGQRVVTENVTAAIFHHNLNRSEEPQTHSHVVLANVTFDQAGKAYSLDTRDFMPSNSTFADKTEFAKANGRFYQEQLGARIAALGYQVERDEHGGVRIAAVTRDQEIAFSQRTHGERGVNAALAEKGLTRETATAAEKNAANRKYRQSKSDHTRDQLVPGWKTIGAQAGLDGDRIVAEARERASSAAYQHNLTVAGRTEASEAVRAAAEHLSERQAVFSARQLAAEAQKRVAPTVRPELVAEAIKLAATDYLHHRQVEAYNPATHEREVQAGFTTAAMIATERQLLTAYGRSTGAVAALMSADQARATVEQASAANQGREFTAEQKAAAAALLSSESRIELLQGSAGVGKTSTVLKTTVASYEKGGFQVRLLAPTGSAADRLGKSLGKDGGTLSSFLGELSRHERQAQRSTPVDKVGKVDGQAKAPTFADIGRKIDNGHYGLKPGGFHGDHGYLTKGLDGKYRQDFLNGFARDTAVLIAGTIAKLNHEIRDAKSSPEVRAGGEIRPSGEVWVLDEAGLVSTKDLAELVRHAERVGARLVLTGDRQQGSSVGAGRAFAQLQDVAGGRVRLVTEIKRQQGELREAVEAARAGDIAGSIAKLQAAGSIFATGLSKDERIQAVARDFAALSKEERTQTLVISLTKEDTRRVNDEIRLHMSAAGELGAGGRFQTLVSRDLTKTELREIANYERGDVVRIGTNKGMGALGAGTDRYFTVDAVDRGSRTVMLRDAAGGLHQFDPKQAQAFGVETFKPVVQEIREGDRLRWSRSDRDQGRLSQQEATVEKVALRTGKLTVRLENGERQTLTMGSGRDQHVAYAYARTGMGTQGLEGKNAFINMGSEHVNLGTIEAFYTNVSRAVEHVRIYTDDLKRLAENTAQRSGQKQAALDRDPIARAKPDPHQQAAAALREWRSLRDIGQHEAAAARAAGLVDQARAEKAAGGPKIVASAMHQTSTTWQELTRSAAPVLDAHHAAKMSPAEGERYLTARAYQDASRDAGAAAKAAAADPADRHVAATHAAAAGKRDAIAAVIARNPEGYRPHLEQLKLSPAKVDQQARSHYARVDVNQYRLQHQAGNTPGRDRLAAKIIERVTAEKAADRPRPYTAAAIRAGLEMRQVWDHARAHDFTQKTAPLSADDRAAWRTVRDYAELRREAASAWRELSAQAQRDQVQIRSLPEFKQYQEKVAARDALAGKIAADPGRHAPALADRRLRTAELARHAGAHTARKLATHYKHADKHARPALARAIFARMEAERHSGSDGPGAKPMAAAVAQTGIAWAELRSDARSPSDEMKLEAHQTTNEIKSSLDAAVTTALQDRSIETEAPGRDQAGPVTDLSRPAEQAATSASEAEHIGAGARAAEAELGKEAFGVRDDQAAASPADQRIDLGRELTIDSTDRGATEVPAGHDLDAKAATLGNALDKGADAVSSAAYLGYEGARGIAEGLERAFLAAEYHPDVFEHVKEGLGEVANEFASTIDHAVEQKLDQLAAGIKEAVMGRGDEGASQSQSQDNGFER